MTREELEALSLTKEQIDSVIKINSADIKNAEQRAESEFANIKAEKASLSKQVADRDKQIEALKQSAGDNADLQKEIAELQRTNKEQEAAHAKEMQQLRLDAAVEKMLTDSGAKNIKAVRALLEMEDVKLSGDGLVKGLAEQIEKLKSDEGSKFMFKEAEQSQNTQSFTGFQPGTTTMLPDAKRTGYETRLAEARKNGDQLEVIKIKEEAHANDGLVLM